MDTNNLPLGGFLGLKVAGASVIVVLFSTILFVLGVNQSKYIIYIAIIVGLVGMVIHFAIMLLAVTDEKERTSSYYNKLSKKLRQNGNEK